MTTSELIKQLQKADPEGNTHIRITSTGEDLSGIPDFVDKLPGYWDGFYAYEDKDENIVFTSADSKVDIHILCYDNWVSRHLDDWQDKLKFNYIYLDEEKNKERANSVIKSFKEHELEYKRTERQVNDRLIIQALKKIKDGWKLVEKKQCGYIVLDFKKGLKKEPAGNGYSHLIMTCGFFKKEGKQWILGI